MDRKEILFWMVYRNKYIRFKIFCYLDYNEWIGQFKDINHLNAMIKNKQYVILKYKIICNQYIYDNFLHPQNCYKSLNEKEFPWVHLFSIDLNEDYIDLKLFCELVKLFLKKYDKQLQVYMYMNKLVCHLFKFSTSFQMINIVLGILKVGQTFEFLISKSYDNEYLDSSIFYRFFNAISENKIIKDQLLDITLKLIISKHQQQDQLKFVNMVKLNLEVMFLIFLKSSTIQNQLIDLDLVIKMPWGYDLFQIQSSIVGLFGKNSTNNKSNEHIIGSLLLCIRLMMKQPQQQVNIETYQHLKDMDENEIIKELLKEIILKSKSILVYQLYLTKYGTTTNELLNLNEPIQTLSIKYCLENYSLNILKLLNYEMIKEFKKDLNVISYTEIKIIDLKQSIQFLKLYLSIVSDHTELELQSNRYLLDLENYIIFIIDQVMKKIDINSKTYQTILNDIPNKYKSHQ